MSLKIPDLQVMLPRASEISRTQQVQLQENVLRRQELAAQMAHQREKAEASVNQSPPGEEALIRDDQEREKRRDSKRQKAGKSTHKENKEDMSETDGNSDSKIDILI